MATPAGRYRMLFALYRKDRIGLLNCRLPMYPIDETDGWCDMPGHPNYNRWVKLPFGKSHERLKREDPLYDIIIVLDYNFSRRARNRGSAVFFHLTAERDWTAGCVAIERDLMRRLLPLLSTDTDLVIKA